MPRSLLPFSSWRAGLICAVLIVFAALFTQYGIQYAYGAEFMICSAFLLIILVLFGTQWAAGSALIVSLGLYFLGFGSVTLLLIGLELILVGYLYERKRELLLLWSGLYWLCIGAPFAALFFYLSTDILSAEVLLQYFMFAMNGLLNAFLADIIVTYVPWSRVIPKTRKKSVYLSQLLTHLCIAAIFIPFMINMVLDSKQMRSEIETDSFYFLDTQTRLVSDWLYEMNLSKRQSLALSHMIQVGKVERMIEDYSHNSLLKISLYDSNNELIASTDGHWFKMTDMSGNEGKIEKDSISIDGFNLNHNDIQHFFRWLPSAHDYDYETRRWSDGHYVMERQLKEHPINRVVVLLPISHYLKETIELYLQKYTTLFILCSLAAGMSILANRYIVRSLSNLTAITTGMPNKLLTHKIPWPDSNIGEIRSLVHNFRMMSDRLAEMIREMNRMNEKLVDQTTMLETSEEKLQHLAYYDTLTQLPNRHYFTVNLEKALKAAEQKSSSLVLMFIDLDRFKHINDSLGHNIGDSLLVRVGQRLTCCMSNIAGAHICARLGGDEFVVIMEDSCRQDATVVAHQILTQFRESFFVSSYELYISASIGIAMYPDDGTEFTSLLKHADTAMYAAKDRGGQTYMFYDQLHPEQLPERHMLESDLRKALDRGQLHLNYQPIVDVAGVVTAAEVLLRWNHPERGFVSPSKFIPLAEESGLIIPIGDWVLRTACLQHLEWTSKQEVPHFKLSVNVSLRQFLNHDFLASVDRILEQTGFDPESLILEITEGYVHKHVEQAIYVLNQLDKRGIQIAVDDFGTGYSSLSRLKTLPIHILKIDRSFVRHLQSDDTNVSIVQAVIQMGQSMNLKVMAEGVETVEELMQLKALGCTQIQGYLITPPLPAQEFVAQFHQFAMMEHTLGAARPGG
ncbi:putative bifunctional diguanylate cyclase/phosphodiesterase [Paenibacillus agilis]|uniref:EAL domain-containing protein n=1 Tax=Paenibacillus agilis TaxID=3020863 RepID=A0A559IKX3_9BACL|nr:EAL domain-containing protein [Paenibacillus agilis]TVX88281.1 EAL domain-containing protein [Paenibacillus agilis]